MAVVGAGPYGARMRLTKRQIADLRAECNKGGLEAALLAAQLLEIVEKLQASLEATEELAAQARRELARAQASLAELRARSARPAAQGAEPEAKLRAAIPAAAAAAASGGAAALSCAGE